MPERGLRGKIVLAIGCTDGMGFSAAKYIGMEGATIVVNSRREPNVTKATVGQEFSKQIKCGVEVDLE